SVGRAVVLQHLLDQVDAAARAIELVAEEHVGWAGRGAEAAMDALADDAFGLGEVRALQQVFGEIRLHEIQTKRCCCESAMPCAGTAATPSFARHERRGCGACARHDDNRSSEEPIAATVIRSRHTCAPGSAPGADR